MKKYKWVYWTMFCVPLLMLFTPGTLLAIEETGGIGMEITQLYDNDTKSADKRGSFVVLDVFSGSPAFLNGIQPGDIILQINDKITRKNDFEDILHHTLRGVPFRDVKIVIWRPCSKEKLEFIIQRMQMVY